MCVTPKSIAEPIKSHTALSPGDIYLDSHFYAPKCRSDGRMWQNFPAITALVIGNLHLHTTPKNWDPLFDMTEKKQPQVRVLQM